MKPPNLGSSDGIGGGVWPSVIAISRGEPVAMVIPASSSEDLVADVVEAERELESFGEHTRLRVNRRSLAGR